MAWTDVFTRYGLQGDWQGTMPELWLLAFAVLTPLLSVKDPDRRSAQQLAAVGVGGAFLMVLGSLVRFEAGAFSLDWMGHAIGEAFVVDEASQLLKLLFLFVAFVAVIGAGRALPRRVDEDWGEFFGLLMFATIGMMVVASGRELFTILLGIETASLSSYLLAGFRRDRDGAEAGLKYFVIGAISSGMSIYGISLLYGVAGTTTLSGLREALAGGGFDAASTLAVVLLLGGLGFKISAVPFHAWAPDVYYGGPAPLAGFLAAASKAMGFAALFHVFLLGMAPIAVRWELAVAVVAVASMFFGNLVAIQQTSIRRMLAYSSIAQAGYLLIAVAVAGALASTTGGADLTRGSFALGAGYFHLMMNAAMKMGAFVVVGALLWAGLPDHLDGWRGLGKRAPFLAFAMMVFLLSMAGLPPLGGFWSKFVLFGSAIDAHVIDDYGWLTWLAVIAVVNSAISLFYYLRVIRAMYVQEGETTRIQVATGPLVATGLCLAVVVAAGLSPEWFIRITQEAAQGLLALTP